MSATAATLICPKCQGDMRSYERSGITIDQCTECRGVFLDRGELERLVDAEASQYSAEPGPREQEQRGEKPKRRKRGGFLGDFFEMGD